VEGFLTCFAPHELHSFLEQFGHRFCDSREVRNESTIVSRQSQETADLVYGLGWFPIQHLLNFARIYRDTILGNGVPQEFHTFQLEFTFGELFIKLMISQTLKDNSEVFGMFFIVFRVDEDIIDKDHYEFVKLHHKHGVHEVHEVGWGIRETKRHHQELVKTVTSGESGFRNVIRLNLDLMITRTKIDLGENFGSSQLIKKNIDSGKRIFVLDGYCIERSVIHTQSQATIFLLDEESGTTPRQRARANITLI
jgi:hypothetical protein